MKVGVLTFPGSNCTQDIFNVMRDFYSAEVDILWHANSIDEKYDILFVPGGFSYGDYLRTGALAARCVAMRSLEEHVKRGGYVIGICNGFQILCETHLLPGALLKNRNLKHISKDVGLIPNPNNKFTKDLPADKILTIPISHGEGNFYAPEEDLKSIVDNNQIAFKYSENPNGALLDIAGVTNKNHRVLGLMPHPERAVDSLTGGTDGHSILTSFINCFMN